MAFFRLTGVVRQTRERVVAGRKDPSQMFTFRNAVIELAPMVTTRVDLESDQFLTEGEVVDLVVEATPAPASSPGGALFLNVRMRGYWHDQAAPVRTVKSA